MSTRKLIITALLCAFAILVAGTVLLLQVGSIDEEQVPERLPASTTTTAA